VRTEAARVNDALGNALVVEVEDLLPEVEVLQRGGPSLADPQGVLVVSDRDTLLGRQPLIPGRHDLVGLTTCASVDRDVVDVDRLEFSFVLGHGFAPVRARGQKRGTTHASLAADTQGSLDLGRLAGTPTGY
jgi:hypothetical protein